ncbi:lateral signaling target protein 2 homolog [Tubulanus polymorphus]|uniref:lateral signaling target protein 2 homolog n=1 Tax=Tubulanus polymorphus TaxID=672921 RepID=UPI003DA50778
MNEAIPHSRANRDFRAKFPDDVVQENLSGQLWFGAECLAAGSSIMNREPESGSMRPLARALTRTLDNLRAMLREQSLKNVNHYSNLIKEALTMFDQLFAEFEFSYVSAMVPVKTFKDYETMQDVIVLFSETIQRAIKKKYLSQDMIEDCDPALMFTIPRLAIVGGLLIFPNGPLCTELLPVDMSEMFRPFQNLLSKIRQLLKTLSDEELHTLEKTLCNVDEPVTMTTDLLASPVHHCVEVDHHHATATAAAAAAAATCIQTQAIVENYYMSQSESKQTIVGCGDLPAASTSSIGECCDIIESDNTDEHSARRESRSSFDSIESTGDRRGHVDSSSIVPSAKAQAATTESTVEERQTGASCSERVGFMDVELATTESAKSDIRLGCDISNKDSPDPDGDDKSLSRYEIGAYEHKMDDFNRQDDSRHFRMGHSVADVGNGTAFTSIDNDGVDDDLDDDDDFSMKSIDALCDQDLPSKSEDSKTSAVGGDEDVSEKQLMADYSELSCSCADKEDCMSFNSTDTSSYNSECQDEEEIAMAIRAAEIASQSEARARFHSSDDLIHRLFVCIAGVADQLQTNYASDLRNILRVVFEMHSSDTIIQSPAKSPKPSPGAVRTPRYTYRPNGQRLVREPPTWVPDEVCQSCSTCKDLFTLVRRRHHCRNCGKIFCSRCSANFIPLPHYGHMKPVRVCNHCFMHHCTSFTNAGRHS